ncbi:TPA: hypothetical protein RNS88_003637 [Stenotrophomonas maltophilia]|nr:hypothetical protein [Stenotrophomonas maltophilia]
MVITILSSITVLASVGIVYVSGKAKRRTLKELSDAVVKSEAMLSEMRAMRGAADEQAQAQAQEHPRVKEASDTDISWVSEAILAVSAHEKKAEQMMAQLLVLQREAEEAQFVRDRLVSVLSIRGSGAERLTDVDGRWLFDRDNRLASSIRATRRRERGIPHSSEVPGWAASVH